MISSMKWSFHVQKMFYPEQLEFAVLRPVPGLDETAQAKRCDHRLVDWLLWR